MERLTSRIDGKVCYSRCEFKDVLRKLADYEDSEEQGLLLRLPCKVGDTVYQIHTLPKSSRKVLAQVEADAFFITLCVLEKRFGKTVFLTKEEAEKALAERKGV